VYCTGMSNRPEWVHADSADSATRAASCPPLPSTMSSQSFLVVGGCGFLGWTIIQALLARGDQAVAVFDIAQRHEDKRVQFFTGDMCDQAVVERAIKQVSVLPCISKQSQLHSKLPRVSLLLAVGRKRRALATR